MEWAWVSCGSGVLLADAPLRNIFESRVHLDKPRRLQRILSLRRDTAKRSDLLFDFAEHCTALRSECDLEHVLRYC